MFGLKAIHLYTHAVCERKGSPQKPCSSVSIVPPNQDECEDSCGGERLKKKLQPFATFKTAGRTKKKNNSMTLLIAPHPSSPVSGTQDKPFSPHSRRSGAKLSEGHPASPLSLTWYIVFKIHVVLSLVFIAQRPRHLYLIAPKPLLGWEY